MVNNPGINFNYNKCVVFELIDSANRNVSFPPDIEKLSDESLNALMVNHMGNALTCFTCSKHISYIKSFLLVTQVMPFYWQINQGNQHIICCGMNSI